MENCLKEVFQAAFRLMIPQGPARPDSHAVGLVAAARAPCTSSVHELPRQLSHLQSQVPFNRFIYDFLNDLLLFTMI